MADSTDNGMASFRAQEKSTIRMDRALVGLRVSSHVRTVPPRLQGTRASARVAAFPSAVDLSCSDSSIMVTIRSNRVAPAAFFTHSVISPSSMAVPAYTYMPSSFFTGTDSPVRLAWFTMASPDTTTPSSGITFPICTVTISFSRILERGTSTSVPSTFCHTLVILRDILLARSPSDFLWVHSSKSSPIPKRNITEPAVSKSLLTMETIIAVASRTSTSKAPFNRQRIPLIRYRIPWYTV